jgi:hypothetical protein
MRFSFPAALTFVSIAASASSASAFCRTTTEPIPADYSPSEGCWTQGKLLYWKNHCVGYSLERNASRQVTLAQATQGMSDAFARWSGAACPGGGHPSIEAVDQGPVACSAVEYNQNSPNAHVIVFRDDKWPHSDPNNTLALTTVTFNLDTGEVYDADMEINTAESSVSVTGPVAGKFDFASIVTHEAGHFLGLAHSSETSAIMFAHYKPGGAVEPTSDDVAGICETYAPNGERKATSGTVPEEACDPTPRHGFGACLLPDGGLGPVKDGGGIGQPESPATTTSGGCSTSPGAPSATGMGTAGAIGGLGAFAVAAAGLAGRKRRKRPGRPDASLPGDRGGAL